MVDLRLIAAAVGLLALAFGLVRALYPTPVPARTRLGLEVTTLVLILVTGALVARLVGYF